jgi:hypothetical protein
MGDRASTGMRRTELMLAPAPGTTVEVDGSALDCSSEILVVVQCLHAESWLAITPANGRLWAVMHPTDVLEVQRGAERFRVPAGMTALPPAPSALVMVASPPLGESDRLT